MSIIEIKKLHKTYNEGKENAVYALRGLDFVAEEGDSVAIMGVSGSGKSTLLHILGCLDDFGEGEFVLNGQSVRGLSAKAQAILRNKEVGFVLQEYGLLLNESVFNNVRLPLMFNDEVAYSAIKATVEGVLKKMNIADLAKKKVSQLSGGQKQRVAIARAIVNDPSIILADEPTGALDSTTAKEIIDVLLGLNKQGKTLIVVTHDKAVADMMARTVNISDGIIK